MNNLKSLEGKDLQIVISVDGASEKAMQVLSNALNFMAQEESLEDIFIIEGLGDIDLSDATSIEQLFEYGGCCPEESNSEFIKGDFISLMTTYIERMRERIKGINAMLEKSDVMVSFHEEPLLKLLFTDEQANNLNLLIATSLSPEVAAKVFYESL